MTTQTAMIANEKQTNEQTDEDKEDQKSWSGQANAADKGRENQRAIDLTDEVDRESIEREKVDDEHGKEDEEEGVMQEAMQETKISQQDTSSIEDINIFISKIRST
jgi:hypothetical protein